MRISLITAVLNGGETIQGALDAIADQTYTDIEHIVVDGGSTDRTLEILRESRRPIDVLLSGPDSGIYDALNKGIEASTGDVLGFLHADDVFAHRQVIERIAEAFKVTGVQAVYGDLEYVKRDDVNHVVRRWRAGHFSSRRLAWGWMPPHPTLYARRGMYARFGTFDTTKRIAADYDCVLRFFGRGGATPFYIPEVLIKMRVGGASNRSVANILRKSREDYVALTSNGVGGIGALLWKNLSKLGQFI
jgi:glycosyltransferase involved in cell wall biosynthesis